LKLNWPQVEPLAEIAKLTHRKALVAAENVKEVVELIRGE
jgi:hypothetical protein